MPYRNETYAVARSAPYFLERGAAQQLRLEIRDGPTGSLMLPASGTITIERPDGTNLVAGAAVTISSAVATYEITPAATEPLGEGWTTYWTLVFGTTTYPIYRIAALMCEYVPASMISAQDLFAEIPELRYRVPQQQGERGDNVGWQPQIDGAYWDFLNKILESGGRPWLIREGTGYRAWQLARAIQRCVLAIPAGLDGQWAQERKDAHFRMQAAEGGLRLQYETERAGIRRGVSPTITLMPVGRDAW